MGYADPKDDIVHISASGLGGSMDDLKKVGDCRLICELPPGTTVKALNGCLVACHPNHAPIYIGNIWQGGMGG